MNEENISVKHHTVPAYPFFKTLSLEDKRFMNAKNSEFQPYSDFNFTSLYCWSGQEASEISLLNNNLVIRMPHYLHSNKKVYSILGTHRIDETLLELLAHTDELTLVPDVVINNIMNPELFIVSEDEDNHDYIYDIEKLSAFEGSDYKKMRNKVNKFEKDHEGHKIETVVTTIIHQDRAESIRRIDEQWKKIHHDDNLDIRSERQALDKLLLNADKLNLIVVELLIDGEIKAFSINELLSEGYAICHFEKALKEHHDYLSAYFVKIVASEMKKHGYRFVNWEQDLGLSGLRHSKRSYKPAIMLKKYSINLSPKIGKNLSKI
ncbi:MAG: phosphatidylglycerol lysyltransferase domain-containing protein [Candidatus Saccharibacteria bacterium]|nr:phosphatidylglycerol lysyltransferase domain-containing protein [Candidatus Saccharibacteria bacterium]